MSIDHILFDAVSSAEYARITEDESKACALSTLGQAPPACVYREKRRYDYCVEGKVIKQQWTFPLTPYQHDSRSPQNGMAQ